MEKQKDRGNLGGNMSKTAVNWTKEQQQVIESRGCHLLVSAAAGSGKTAVLVERIIRMVTEGENPLDIDRLLVMTFTNAAAAEMRERIGEAIEPAFWRILIISIFRCSQLWFITQRLQRLTAFA